MFSQQYSWSFCRWLWPTAVHPGVHVANLHTIPLTDVVWSVKDALNTTRRHLFSHASQRSFQKTQQCHHRNPILSLNRHYKSAFGLSSSTSDWIKSTDLYLCGCKWCMWILQWWRTCSCCQMIYLQVCLSASQEVSHSLLLSPDGWKRLIYSGFKDTFFSSSFPHDFVSQEVVSFPLNPNQTDFWCHRGVLHESMIFRRESGACGTSYSRIEERIHTCFNQTLIKVIYVFVLLNNC